MILLQSYAKSDLLIIVFNAREKRAEHLDLVSDLESIKCNKLFIRDMSNTWYTNGIENIKGGYDGLVNFLQQIVDMLEIKNVVTTGSSAGGYAAILFGNLLKATEIHAFAPQISLDIDFLKKIKDDRWDINYETRTLFPINHHSKIYVHYSCPIDKKHAQLLNNIDNVQIIEHKGNNHRVLQYLKTTDKLKDYLLEIKNRLS